jgi:hypothetical protein
LLIPTQHLLWSHYKMFKTFHPFSPPLFWCGMFILTILIAGKIVIFTIFFKFYFCFHQIIELIGISFGTQSLACIVPINANFPSFEVVCANLKPAIANKILHPANANTIPA